jgi:signal transduction histidine kinase
MEIIGGILLTCSQFSDSMNKVHHWVGTATDIHDLKLLEEQKDDFISIASHELKTPITTLSASLQLLNKMKDKPAVERLPTLIDHANKSLEKVNHLVKNLLNVTQFNKGQLHLDKSWISLSVLIKDSCAQVLADKTYTFRTEGNLDVQVYADALRIEQIIVNFVNNAIKYAPDSKEIQIAIEDVNDRVKVSVTDKGKGIAPDKIPHLFNRYFRANGTSSKYSGLGLGLYICSEIIREHKGEIGVDSELGKGSTFWFMIPKESN